MGWTLKAIDERTIRTNLAGKLSTGDVDTAVRILKGAKNAKQAVAVSQHVEKLDELTRLRDAGFQNISDNSKEKIRNAITAAAEIIRRNRELHERELAQRDLQDRLNARINGYLESIQGAYVRHMGGMVVQLNGEDSFRVYGNREGILPRGQHYIEWYASIGGTRSMDKRFITHLNDPRIWYTEGGTHGQTDYWFIRENAGDDWIPG
jgi:hypothetical protein